MKSNTDCKEWGRLKNVVGQQEKAKKAFGLETHQEFDF